jgi:serine/threonine protein phosphatase PrpC
MKVRLLLLRLYFFLVSPFFVALIKGDKMGSALSRPLTTGLLRSANNMTVSCGAAAVNGVRTEMEDRHLVLLDDNFTGFFAVFDGHGGKHCAEFVQEAFRSEMAASKCMMNLDKMREFCLDVDVNFIKDSTMSSGTTAACVSVHNDPTVDDGKSSKVCIAHVGDSRVIIGDFNGQVRYETKDHKPNTSREETSRILANGYRVSGDRINGNLNMSRAFGDAEYKQSLCNRDEMAVIPVPDVMEYQLDNEHEFILITSDGLFDGTMNSERAMRYVAEQLRQKRLPLDTICYNLCLEAIRLNSTDNITCILVVPTSMNFETSDVSRVVPGKFDVKAQRFLLSYKQMAELGGVTVGECLMLRWYELYPEMIESLPHDKAYEKEVEMFGNGPKNTAEAFEKRFNELLEECRNSRV